MTQKKVITIFLALCLLMVPLSVGYAVVAEDPIACIPLETNADILQLNDGSGPNLLDTYSNDTLADAEIMNIELENNLAIAGEAYDSLMKTFYNAQPDSQKHNPDIYTVSGISAEGFPRTFAGAYINRNLDLVVLMTEDTIQTRAMLACAEDTMLQATGTDQLIFSTAEFSYSDLVSLMDDIYQYLKTGRNGEDGFYIVHYSLDDYNNRVLVGLASDSEECRTSFQNTIGNSDAFAFESANASGYEFTAFLQPGAPLRGGSAGFRVRKYENGSYIYGFVAAAHCFAPGEEVYSGVDGSLFGYASPNLHQREGNIDAVFVVSDESFGERIRYSGDEHLRSGIDTNLAQGHTVSKSGKTTQVTTGVIEYASRGFTWDKKNYYDFGVSDYACDKGDSGGIVYTTRSGNNWIAGIVNGRYRLEDDGEIHSFFCKAINITSAFGLSLY